MIEKHSMDIIENKNNYEENDIANILVEQCYNLMCKSKDVVDEFDMFLDGKSKAANIKYLKDYDIAEDFNYVYESYNKYDVNNELPDYIIPMEISGEYGNSTSLTSAIKILKEQPYDLIDEYLKYSCSHISTIKRLSSQKYTIQIDGEDCLVTLIEYIMEMLKVKVPVTIKLLNDNIIEPSEKDKERISILKEIRNDINELTGTLACILFYDFNFERTLIELLNLKLNTSAIDRMCLKFYIDRGTYYLFKEGALTDNSFLNTALNIRYIIRAYRPSISVFDEYPEKEQPFMDIMGYYIIGIEDKITLENVEDIINGRKTPEDLNIELTSSDNEEVDSMQVMSIF